MYLTIEDFRAIDKALMMLPSGNKFATLSKEEQDIIINAKVVMTNLLKKRKVSNKKTAKYIADKRKSNPDYAR